MTWPVREDVAIAAIGGVVPSICIFPMGFIRSLIAVADMSAAIVVVEKQRLVQIAISHGRKDKSIFGTFIHPVIKGK